MVKTYHIRVIPNASCEKIISYDTGYKVYVTLSPKKGKVNEKIRRMFADYFHVATQNVAIVKGTYSRNKKIEVSFL